MVDVVVYVDIDFQFSQSLIATLTLPYDPTIRYTFNSPRVLLQRLCFFPVGLCPALDFQFSQSLIATFQAKKRKHHLSSNLSILLESYCNRFTVLWSPLEWRTFNSPRVLLQQKVRFIWENNIKTFNSPRVLLQPLFLTCRLVPALFLSILLESYCNPEETIKKELDEIAFNSPRVLLQQPSSKYPQALYPCFQFSQSLIATLSGDQLATSLPSFNSPRVLLQRRLRRRNELYCILAFNSPRVLLQRAPGRGSLRLSKLSILLESYCNSDGLLPGSDNSYNSFNSPRVLLQLIRSSLNAWQSTYFQFSQSLIATPEILNIVIGWSYFQFSQSLIATEAE